MKTHGTQEWSVKTVNCCTGCSHDCRYCYAKGMAVRFRQSPRVSGHLKGFDRMMSSNAIKNTTARSCSRHLTT